jgi:hypothetical protein
VVKVKTKAVKIKIFELCSSSCLSLNLQSSYRTLANNAAQDIKLIQYELFLEPVACDLYSSKTRIYPISLLSINAVDLKDTS